MRKAGLFLAVLALCSLPACAEDKKEAPKIGQSVFALYQAAEVYFAATVVEEDKDNKGKFRVVFEDGDTAVVTPEQIRPLEIKEGTKVLARWKDGRFYPGKVAKIVGRALYIHYDDGDKDWASMGNIAVK